MTPDPTNLEHCFFPYVEKPGRYIGGELGLPRLPENPSLRVALAFPDVYELGMSYLGLRILYHLANQSSEVACERVFMPWFDAVKRMRECSIPLFSLETRTPLNHFDLIGINLQYELHATNILGILDLSQIPLLAQDRKPGDPIVIGGGPLSLHPEPFAPFFDAIVVGDGEEVFPKILEQLILEKRHSTLRQQTVRNLGDFPGVYLPAYYQPRYNSFGQFDGFDHLDPTLPTRIERRITPELKSDHYPAQPIVPTLELTHNRLIIEIARGCSRGCRFCAPGMANRPVREREIPEIVNAADLGLSATGYNEVSLLSLSSADYSCLGELLDGLAPILDSHRASLSFPSLRPDLFTPQMADRAATGNRTGLTFAPEAATVRLRGIINKATSDEALLNAAALAFERGWKSIKLYFMLGLPGEEDADVWAIVDLVKQVESAASRFGGRQINVSVSPFTPKPHSPFERSRQLTMEELRHRIGILRQGLQRSRNVKLDIRRPEISQIEAAIARGDRRVAMAILACYHNGGLFDAWSDGFSFRRWESAFKSVDLNIEQIVGKISPVSRLPWGIINSGIDDQFINAENRSSDNFELTPDCRVEGCQFCGLQAREDIPCPEIRLPSPTESLPHLSHVPEPATVHRYRIKYQRDRQSRYHAHLSVVGVFERALRRLNLPLEFTQGMRPHLRLIASPPLAMGMTSRAEYIEFGIELPWTDDLTIQLQSGLPAGLRIDSVHTFPINHPSLGALNIFQYRARPCMQISGDDVKASMTTMMEAASLPVQRIGPEKTQTFDARPSLWVLAYVEGDIVWGVINRGGPSPRSEDVFRMLFAAVPNPPDLQPHNLLADWEIERLGMWWEVDGVRIAPDYQPA
jgi:radical SAM family uncharacterized protein/radical SAM-linked protein